MKVQESATILIALQIAILSLCSCGSQQLRQQPPSFEPRLEHVRAEAAFVFALAARDEITGLTHYLSHREPVVRFIAHQAVLTSLHYRNRGLNPPPFDPFLSGMDLKKSRRKWLAWLRSVPEVKSGIRENPRPKNAKMQERQLLEAAIAALRKLGRVQDVDLLSEMLDSESEAIKVRALRVLRDTVGGPGAKETPQARQATNSMLCEWWQKWWLSNRGKILPGLTRP